MGDGRQEPLDGASFRALAEATSAGIWHVTPPPDARTLYANPALCSLIGVELAELQGRSALEFIAPEDRERVGAAMQTRLEGVASTHEVTMVTARGERREVRVSGAPVRDRSGRVVSMIGTFIDTTGQRQAEEALRRSEEQLRQAISAAGMATFEWDIVTDEVKWSARDPRIFGRGATSLVDALGQVEAGERGGVQGRVEQLLQDPGAHDFDLEVCATRPDGTTVWRRFKGAIERDDAGRPLRMIGADVDVTERRQLQEQLLRAQKFESLGRLAGGVAHDFNNLLTVIVSAARMARRGDAERSLDDIESAAARGSELTGQLLAFARRQVISVGIVDLRGLLEDVHALLRRVVGEDIALDTILGDELWRIRADRSPIEQVLVNLAINARDAMPDGGRLSIRASNAELDPQAAAQENGGLHAGRYVRIAVTDTGSGMDAETVANAFEPFFTTRGSRGTGLGLATCYGIVTQLGGRIRVDSAPGEGATFDILLPATEEREVAFEREDTPTPGGAETILLVEDEDAVRRVAAEVLHDLGYRVHSAAGASDALAIAGELGDRIDLVVSDVVMPEMNGVKLVERLAADNPRLSALFVSGYPGDEHVAVATGGVGRAFLPKPYTPDDLGLAVRRLLDARNVHKAP